MATVVSTSGYPLLTSATNFPEPFPLSSAITGGSGEITVETDSANYLPSDIINIYAYPDQTKAENATGSESDAVMMASFQNEYVPENSTFTQTFSFFDNSEIPDTYADADGNLYLAAIHGDRGNLGVIEASAGSTDTSTPIYLDQPSATSGTPGIVEASILAYSPNVSETNIETITGTVEATVDGVTKSKFVDGVTEKLLNFRFENVSGGSHTVQFDALNNSDSTGSATSPEIQVDDAANLLEFGNSTAYVDDAGDLHAVTDIINNGNYDIEATIEFAVDGQTTQDTSVVRASNQENFEGVFGLGSGDYTVTMTITGSGVAKDVSTSVDGGDGGSGDRTPTASEVTISDPYAEGGRYSAAVGATFENSADSLKDFSGKVELRQNGSAVFSLSSVILVDGNSTAPYEEVFDLSDATDPTGTYDAYVIEESTGTERSAGQVEVTKEGDQATGTQPDGAGNFARLALGGAGLLAGGLFLMSRGDGENR